ncbi:MAG: hypothetical protein JOY90_19775 [Bradyrhizobium sp.]|uniref:hypothetical protein n=1 Tax=Bradyrhizobium sp. TaxID=376 RepID=UPI001D89400E|nr:hypothetical protein [Bradyrhizobium sp.]MBV9562654.1 hypothetical protein [Bradyrhizobium sp.]
MTSVVDPDIVAKYFKDDRWWMPRKQPETETERNGRESRERATERERTHSKGLFLREHLDA